MYDEEDDAGTAEMDAGVSGATSGCSTASFLSPPALSSAPSGTAELFALSGILSFPLAVVSFLIGVATGMDGVDCDNGVVAAVMEEKAFQGEEAVAAVSNATTGRS